MSSPLDKEQASTCNCHTLLSVDVALQGCDYEQMKEYYSVAKDDLTTL